MNKYVWINLIILVFCRQIKHILFHFLYYILYVTFTLILVYKIIYAYTKWLSKGIWKVVFICLYLVCFSLCRYFSMLCISRLLSKSVWIHSIIFLLLNHHYINWYHINQGLCYGHIDKVVSLQLQLSLLHKKADPVI